MPAQPALLDRRATGGASARARTATSAGCAGGTSSTRRRTPQRLAAGESARRRPARCSTPTTARVERRAAADCGCADGLPLAVLDDAGRAGAERALADGLLEPAGVRGRPGGAHPARPAARRRRGARPAALTRCSLGLSAPGGCRAGSGSPRRWPALTGRQDDHDRARRCPTTRISSDEADHARSDRAPQARPRGRSAARSGSSATRRRAGARTRDSLPLASMIDQRAQEAHREPGGDERCRRARPAPSCAPPGRIVGRGAAGAGRPGAWGGV